MLIYLIFRLSRHFQRFGDGHLWGMVDKQRFFLASLESTPRTDIPCCISDTSLDAEAVS